MLNKILEALTITTFAMSINGVVQFFKNIKADFKEGYADGKLRSYNRKYNLKYNRGKKK